MQGTRQAKGGTHIIFAGNISKVHEAFRTSQNSGLLMKIILVIPYGMSNNFKNLGKEISKYCTKFEIKDVDISNISWCALLIYELATKERKKGYVVTLNLTDSSVFAFTISACLVGAVTKSKVITSSSNDTPVAVPLTPYCRIAMKRYEILKALGDSGADNTESLKMKLKKLFKTGEIEVSNLSAQLRILEERGFIVREKNRQSKRITRTSLGLLIQKAYEDYPSSSRPKK